MNINLSVDSLNVSRALDISQKQTAFAISVTLNKLANQSRDLIKSDMQKVFDRPTPFFLNSLRVIPAKKTNLEATIWFKDRSGDLEPMALPHIDGGQRRMKPMERRLQIAGLLPNDWQVVPGEGAAFDSYGNMSRGQISLILNVLRTYREAGYNKANHATIQRLKKGTKKNYGYEIWVNTVSYGRGKTKRLLPGVYKRVSTPFGSSLKPLLIFTRKGTYKKRLQFYETVQDVVSQNFNMVFIESFNRAMSTARYEEQLQLKL